MKRVNVYPEASDIIGRKWAVKHGTAARVQVGGGAFIVPLPDNPTEDEKRRAIAVRRHEQGHVSITPKDAKPDDWLQLVEDARVNQHLIDCGIHDLERYGSMSREEMEAGVNKAPADVEWLTGMLIALHGCLDKEYFLTACMYRGRRDGEFRKAYAEAHKLSSQALELLFRSEDLPEGEE